AACGHLRVPNGQADHDAGANAVARGGGSWELSGVRELGLHLPRLFPRSERAAVSDDSYIHTLKIQEHANFLLKGQSYPLAPETCLAGTEVLDEASTRARYAHL